MRLRPVHTQKQENTWSNISQNAGTAPITIVLALGVDQADVSSATEVAIGTTIRSIYLEFHFSAAETGNVNVIHWTVRKLPFSTADTNPNTYNQPDKRFIFKRGMEMLPVNVSTVFKRILVVRIPPRFSRIGEADQLIFTYQASSTQLINACGFSILKAIT